MDYGELVVETKGGYYKLFRRGNKFYGTQILPSGVLGIKEASEEYAFNLYSRPDAIRYVKVLEWDLRLKGEELKSKIKSLGPKVRFNLPSEGPPISLVTERDKTGDIMELDSLSELHEEGYLLVIQRRPGKVQIVATRDQMVIANPNLVWLSKFQVSRLEKSLMPEIMELMKEGRLREFTSYSVDVPGIAYNGSSVPVKGEEICFWRVKSGPIVVAWDHDLGDMWIENTSPERIRDTKSVEVLPGVQFEYVT